VDAITNFAPRTTWNQYEVWGFRFGGWERYMEFMTEDEAMKFAAQVHEPWRVTRIEINRSTIAITPE